MSNINTFVQEHIVGMNLVQIFNREESEYKKFKQINKDHLSAHLRSVFYSETLFNHLIEGEIWEKADLEDYIYNIMIYKRFLMRMSINMFRLNS